ncbi:MAG: DUF5056 domain-containing protein [Bacteroidaceae bacterium]|nr:DUF5056 domain-containing protein [Bacteroidaceae bacterium]
MDKNNLFRIVSPSVGEDLNLSEADEALVRSFLKQQTAHEIADGGFTRKVMRHLPASLEYVALYLQVAASSAAVYMMLHYIDWSSLVSFDFIR